MGLKEYKPTSPGRRDTVADDYKDITRSKPEKSLLGIIKKTGGRNNRGRITVRHRGGGHKRRYRIVDFKRDKSGTATVMSIEYDPNRTARIALVLFEDGIKRYIVAPNGVTVGDTVASGEDVPVTTGNSRPLGTLPTGTLVHNVEVTPGKGGQMVKSAGAVAQVMAHESGYTLIRLPSGEMRRLLSNCSATVGQVSNLDHKNEKLGKAGRNRHRGRRPSVRGSAMNPDAHPHGGGEGRAGIGMPGPKTPWGQPALGKRTRRNKKTNKFILRRRYDR
ncbi:MAG: 50S ribosomal protein L2 [Chloroflexi bacterium]|jgi:large subunit ribosomal protein L2|nr:50S ribosomal protein L2 [Chloroflexota bacterium]MBT3864199.1 50S ribosomal protein L2 [Chloroflexota bacterium]MBT4142529.1 50S ribosomal protein L2 [Chloroflexota bacterium]MBT4341316.1 50S ribosomal protein L2 [Chloroflexota bacterium]MBT4944470.1 50S ribosomal protein L2 [Chloroflexota bacterium]